MRKLILTLGMVIILGLTTVVPAFASAPPADSVPGQPDCFGKMASDQAQQHQGYKNVAADHGKNSVKEANWQQLDVEISVGSRDDSNEVFTNSGTVQLDCLEGNVRLAFRYLGSDPGASTTYDLDNILIMGNNTSE